MSQSKRLALCFAVFSILVLVDIGFRVREWRDNSRVLALSKLFEVVTVHTNAAFATVIIDRKTKQPLWGKWKYDSGDQSVSYFYDGRNVMNFYPREGEAPRFDVTFFGDDGTVKALWINRGSNAFFTERARYDVDVPRKEIWFNERWYPLVPRTNNDGSVKGGIIFDGKWRHPVFTNGSAALEP